MRPGVVATLILASLVWASGLGCGSNEAAYVSATVPVKGTISFKGQLLKQGTVTFEPTDAGREAHGNIKPDGTFVLTTFKEGDGAVKGVHKVLVAGAGRGVRPLKITEVEVAEGKTDYAIDLK